MLYFVFTLAAIGFNTISVLSVILPKAFLVGWAMPICLNFPNQIGLLTGVNAMGVEGSGILKTESRQVNNFTAIDVSGSFKVEIVAGQTPTLKIIADDNILPLIVTEVKGNTLLIYTREKIAKAKELQIKISSREIEKISASGANIIKLSNISNEALDIAHSGGGKIELQGKTQDLHIVLSGASTLKAKNLAARKVKIDISGAANADVYVSDRLDITIVGTGNVNYYGNPKTVRKKILGVGSIDRK